ncbi:MAG: hypothetical protein NVSMB51_09880 [Solirubrobacteraceae bacterium]
MRAIVVVPAHQEEDLIADCIGALADQHCREPFAAILVLDRCTDATAERARAAAAGRLELEVVESREPGVGAARRLGMDLACTRLQDGELIACTDADTTVAVDWLAVQFSLVRSGAVAIGGLVELDPTGAQNLPGPVLRERAARARQRMDRVTAASGGATSDHHHFSGASMSVLAGVYRRIGGLPPRPALEDEALAALLASHEIPITRSAAVRVRTSARTSGRAPRGLARDLGLSSWRARRTWAAGDFDPLQLARERRQTVSVVLPAREVAGTIERVVAAAERLRRGGLVDEVLVIDADSSDGTAGLAAGAGAQVLQESELLPAFGPSLGKGDAMWRGIAASSGELVVFADCDTEDFDERFIVGLLGPLLRCPELRFVKGAFRRPLRVGDRRLTGEGGRVTELIARPLLNLHWPMLAGFDQPLAGEIAADRKLLEALPFPAGYGVETAMLIDAAELAGIDALGQVDLGERQNRHQALRELSAMAYAVLVAAHRRMPGGLLAAPGPLLLPGGGAAEPMEVRTVAVEERPPLASLRPAAAA